MRRSPHELCDHGRVCFRRPVPGGWPRVLLPGLPRLCTCPFRHTATHLMDSVRNGCLSKSGLRLGTDCATVVFHGHGLYFDAPPRSPSNGVRHASPSPRGPRLVPASTRPREVRSPPSHLDPFDFFHEPIPSCRRGLVPSVVASPRARELSVPVSHPGLTMETSGSAQVPGNPGGHCPCFDTGRIKEAEWTKSKLPDTAPCRRRRLPVS